MDKIIFCVMFLVMAVVCKSQTTEIPDIYADRPGMATSPFIVCPKKFQIETGFSYEKMTGDVRFQETILYNSTLIRYGINKNAEIRVQTDFAQVKTDSVNITGFDPFVVGAKLLITEGKGVLPKTSFLFNLTLPWIGKKYFRPENLAPSFYLLMQNDITPKLNVCYNIGLEYDGGSAEPVAFIAFCFGYSFTDKFSAFVENYNWISGSTKPENSIDLGCAYIIGKNIQLDLSGNMNLQDFKNYFMISAGLSWRIMKQKQTKTIKV